MYHFSDLSEIKDSYSRKNDCNSTEKSLKKSKVKNIDNILGFSPELEQAFQMYILVRSNNYGDMIPEQIQALREDLIQLSDSEVERIAIVKKATAGGWKSFIRHQARRSRAEQRRQQLRTITILREGSMIWMILRIDCWEGREEWVKVK